jgi:hypothetical protein
MEILNAKIRKTTLGNERGFILTAWIHVVGASWGVGFGGICLRNSENPDKEKRFADKGLEYLQRILEVVGVENWEELEGCYVRVKMVDQQAYAIGNIIKDEWITKDFFKESEAESA